jgi:WD40 repeat protein
MNGGKPDLFLSYARGDDEPFVACLYRDLTAEGFGVWWDRESMPNRGLKFTLEIRNAIDSCQRLLLVIGPEAIGSEYVRAEWEHALLFAKGVIPILRLGDYDLLPEELKSFHCPDFRSENRISELLRILAEPVAELGPLLTLDGPSLPEHFLPRRADLDRLRNTVLADVERPTVVTSAKQMAALQGMGGIGKTVLAAAFARATDTRRAFTDGIVWLTAGREAGETQLRGNLIRTGAAFGDPYPDHLPKLLEKKACLIVVDDLWTLEQAEPFRRVLGPRCRLLITTRDGMLVTALGAQELSLDVLSPAEALKLLAETSDMREEDLPPEAREIARECGCLPLALALCGAQVRDRRPWIDLLQALRATELEFLDHPQGSVMRSLKVSVDALPAGKQERYGELAVLPEDERVAEAGVLRLWKYTGGLAEHHSRALLAEFHRRALLRLDSAEAVRRISLHDLQHDYLRRATQDLAGLQGRVLQAYSTCCPSCWWTGPNDGYFFEHLAYHLAAAGRGEELLSLLSEYRWLEAKLAATSVDALISDYQWSPRRPAAALVESALRLSAHVLRIDQRQFAGQLTGRLTGLGGTAVEELLWSAKTNAAQPWLRPLHPALHPAGTSLLHTLEGHSDGVRGVAVTPDGTRAVSASSDKTLKVWDLESGRALRTLEGHSDGVRGVAVTPDGKRAVSASGDNTLKVWDLESGRVLRTLEGHSDGVRGVAVTPDGKRAVSASDNKLKVWDLESGRALRTLEGHSSYVASVAVTPDGKQAVSASGDNTLKVWDLESGRALRTLEGHSSYVTSVAVTPDGKQAVSASGDNTLKVWDLEGGLELRTLKGHSTYVLGVAITADGRRAVSASCDHTLKVWDLKTGRELRTLDGHSAFVYGVAVSADGNRSVSASDDRTLMLWDLRTESQLGMPAGHSAAVVGIAVSADGRRAVSTSFDRTLKVWDLETGRVERTLEGLWGFSPGVAVSADGRRAVSNSRGMLTVWDLESGWQLRTLSGLFNAEVSADGQRAVSVSDDQLLRVWDIETGRQVRSLRGHAGFATSVAVSADGRRAVSACYDEALKVWDLETGRELRMLAGHPGRVTAVSISPDGCRAVSAHSDNTLAVWDLGTTRKLRTLKGGSGFVNRVAVSGDGLHVVSASSDRTLKVWHLETGSLVATFTCDAPAFCCTFPGARNVVAGDQSGRVHFLSLEFKEDC